MPKARIEVGRQANGSFTVPRFGSTCICCNADTQGRTQDYDPSTDRIQVSPVPMPVCHACKDHAMQTSTVPALQACGAILGGCLIGISAMYIGDRPHDVFLYAMLVLGIVVLAASVEWIRRTAIRNERERVAGHHPRIELSVHFGRTWLDTTNGQLVDDVLARNPGAQRLPTPLLWRKQEAKELAQARVVRDKREKR